MKKTFDVQEFKEFVNGSLKDSINPLKEYRSGLCTVIEHVLHGTGNYRGYGFLTQNQVKLGMTFGMEIIDGAFPKMHDETRRFYY